MILRLATNAMGTRFELALEGDYESSLRAAGEEALHEIELWHRRLSAFDPASDTSRINRHAASEAWADPLPIDAELAEFLSLCLDVYAASDGAFDPAIGHTMEQLGFRSEPGAHATGHADTRTPNNTGQPSAPVPSRSRSWLSSISPTTLRLAAPNLRLDFGAVGKGWALDRAGDILRNAPGGAGGGVTTALLHAGTSSVLALGPAPHLPPFTIRVRSDAEPLDVALRETALGVSAPRGRTVEHNSRTIGHVLDPRSGLPVDPARVDTAIVLGPSAALADAWSTAALVLGRLPPNLPPAFAASLHTSLGWSPAPAASFKGPSADRSMETA